jgi:hypothetical protein
MTTRIPHLPATSNPNRQQQSNNYLCSHHLSTVINFSFLFGFHQRATVRNTFGQIIGEINANYLGGGRITKYNNNNHNSGSTAQSFIISNEYSKVVHHVSSAKPRKRCKRTVEVEAVAKIYKRQAKSKSNECRKKTKKKKSQSTDVVEMVPDLMELGPDR